METQEEELSDEELARSLRFWARRVYGGERELLEQAERRILKKHSEKSETSRNDTGCLIEILVVVLILRLLGCV